MGQICDYSSRYTIEKNIKFANDIINTIMKNVGRLKGLLKGKG